MATPDFQKQFQSLITDLTKPITTTTPRGSKSSPLSRTAFETNPFEEVKFVDPYAPKDMASLTEAELGIDNVISYLESIIPSDLLATLMNLPDLANELLNRGETLESFIIGIKGNFSYNLNFQDALRNLGIMNIYENLLSFKDKYIVLGNRFQDMGDRFFQKGMSTMGKTRNKFGYSNSGYSLWGGDTNNSGTDKYATTGIAVAETDQMASNHKGYGTIFKEKGNITDKNLTSLAVDTSNKDLPIIIGGIKAVGEDNANAIISDINTSSGDDVINKVTDISKSLASTDILPDAPIDSTQIDNINAVNRMSVDKTLDLKKITTEDSISTDIIKNTSALITSIGIDGTTYIKTKVSLLGVVVIRDSYVSIIKKTISKFNITTLTDIIVYIDENSIALWIANNDRTPVDEFITLLEDLDYLLTKYLVMSLNTIDISDMESSLTTLDETSDINIGKIYDLSNNNLPTFNKDVLTILAADDIQLKTVTKLAINYGTTNLLMYSDLINSLSLENIIPLISSLKNAPLDKVSDSVTTICNLSNEAVSEIVYELIANDPNKVLTKYTELTNPFLNYAVNETCINYANVGEYNVVKDLILTYPNAMNSSEKKTIAKLLLSNYKSSNEEAQLGYSLSSSLFLDTLLLLDPNLLTVERNSESINSLAPWLSASNDALSLLKHNPLCSIGITIAQNKKLRGLSYVN